MCLQSILCTGTLAHSGKHTCLMNAVLSDLMLALSLMRVSLHVLAFACLFLGDSLVPLADLFNHKAAVIHLSNEFVIEGQSSEDDSCDEKDKAADSSTVGT